LAQPPPTPFKQQYPHVGTSLRELRKLGIQCFLDRTTNVSCAVADQRPAIRTLRLDNPDVELQIEASGDSRFSNRAVVVPSTSARLVRFTCLRAFAVRVLHGAAHTFNLGDSHVLLI